MITGGAPTLHPDLLQELCSIIKTYDHIVTIETEGSEFVPTEADLISLSPKLSNSIPQPGTFNPYTEKEVTENDRDQHERWRRNLNVMSSLIEHHADYQFKPVISNAQDFKEIKDLQMELGIPNDKVWLMPEGLTDSQLKSRRQWVMDLCLQHGYNYTDRLHIVAFGNSRGN